MDKLLQDPPTAVFRDLLRRALTARNVMTSDHAEFYLVSLLERFIRTEDHQLARPLAKTYLEACGSDSAVRFQKLREVGDTALFLAGVFQEKVAESPVGATYYVQLGESAYDQLASLSGPARAGGTVAELFGELAQKFEDYVSVLHEMTIAHLFSTDRDLMRIYRRWLRSGSQNDEARLLRLGVIPCPGAITAQ